MGIEPMFWDWKPHVLPLDEGSCLAGEIRIELILTGSKPAVLPLDDSPFENG